MRSVLVTRTEYSTFSETTLALADLQLWQDQKYILPEGTFGAGTLQHRRTNVEGQLIKGRSLTAIVEPERVGNLAVHVIAQDPSDLQPRVEEVISALTQWRFLLTWQYNALGGVWECEPGDWEVGNSGLIDEPWLKAVTQPIYFTIPHWRVSGL